MGSFIDLTGQKFGRLTVVKRVENYVRPSGQPVAKWLCRCDCGNEVEVISTSLRMGKTKSCGCLNREMVSKKHKKYNTYDLSGGYGVGYTHDKNEFYFDIDDYDKIKDYCWYINGRSYVEARDITQKKSHILFHRIILPDEKTIDHINHKKNDNRKLNLRSVTSSQNGMNRGVLKNNASGYTGVYHNKSNNKWYALIRVNNKLIYLGQFTNFEDAVRTRKEAEEKYFGEYSYINSIGRRV